MARIAQMSLDQKGFDKMVAALSPENRKKSVARALRAGAEIVRDKIRSNYAKIKPDSDLGKAIVLYEFPSGEGMVVRRFYKKGGNRRPTSDEKASPLYRSYILNFIEQGAADRRTKGRGKVRRGLNRGSIPAYKFFRKGYSGSRNKAFKEIERVLLTELAKQARK
jgi:hypothetical protein